MWVFLRRLRRSCVWLLGWLSLDSRPYPLHGERVWYRLASWGSTIMGSHSFHNTYSARCDWLAGGLSRVLQGKVVDEPLFCSLDFRWLTRGVRPRYAPSFVLSFTTVKSNSIPWCNRFCSTIALLRSRSFMTVPGKDTVSYSRADLNLNLTVDAILQGQVPCFVTLLAIHFVSNCPW